MLTASCDWQNNWISQGDWKNEAYVSLHLVQPVLKLAGLPPQSAYSHWVPEFGINVPKFSSHGYSTETKKVDFLIEDLSRFINFLVEVKTANTQIDAPARTQLQTYLQYSKTRFGVLIDPFLVEIYEYANGEMKLKTSHKIQNPQNPKPVATFLRNFLDTLKMRTIAIYTSKGGVGKTTLVVNLAYELAKRNHRVLVIDLDDQANASLSLGVNKADEFDQASSLEDLRKILDSFDERKEIIDFMKDYELSDFDYKKYIMKASINAQFPLIGSKGVLDIIPGSNRTIEYSISRLGGIPQKRLNRAIQQSGLAHDYDYLIIDTPPSSTIITENGLYAAQYVILPSQMEYLSVYGMRVPIKNVKEVQDEMNGERGRVLGIVPMMTEKVNLHTTIKALTQATFPDIPVFPEIKRAIAVGQASNARQPLSVFAEQNRNAAAVSKQFSTLTNAVIARIDQLENGIGG